MLGAHDGIVSTAALIVGVAASDASTQSVLLAAIAGLAAGALSMAAGEYVSVSSQRDLERALRAHEEQLTSGYPEVVLTEVAVALQLRGLARTVAEQLVALSPVETAVRVKYGLSSALAARPSSAALAASGAWAARLGSASAWRGAWRVLLGGSLAMGLSALIGRAVGTVV